MKLTKVLEKCVTFIRKNSTNLQLECIVYNGLLSVRHNRVKRNNLRSFIVRQPRRSCGTLALRRVSAYSREGLTDLRSVCWHNLVSGHSHKVTTESGHEWWRGKVTAVERFTSHSLVHTYWTNIGWRKRKEIIVASSAWCNHVDNGMISYNEERLEGKLKV